MNNLIREIIERIALVQTPHNVFYCEATLKFELALEIYKKINIAVTLERKIPNRREYLDIYFEHNAVKYGIELKYKTKSCRVGRFEYENQGAHTAAKYDFLKDIMRLERDKKEGIIDHGIALFVTNDTSYLYPSERGDAALLSIANERTIGGCLRPQGKTRPDPLIFSSQYKIIWNPQPQQAQTPIEGSEQFYCLMLEI